MLSDFFFCVLYCSINQQSWKTDCQRDLDVFFFRVDLEKNEDKHTAADANKNKFKLNSRDVSEEIIKITTQGTRMMDTKKGRRWERKAVLLLANTHEVINQKLIR
jgi:hypothetical protein